MKNPHKTIKKEVVLQATFLILVGAVIIPTSGNNAFAKKYTNGITRQSLWKPAITVKY